MHFIFSQHGPYFGHSNDYHVERWDGVMWTGLVWLRIGTGGELL
jgi:hypothetical protein